MQFYSEIMLRKALVQGVDFAVQAFRDRLDETISKMARFPISWHALRGLPRRSSVNLGYLAGVDGAESSKIRASQNKLMARSRASEELDFDWRGDDVALVALDQIPHPATRLVGPLSSQRAAGALAPMRNKDAGVQKPPTHLSVSDDGKRSQPTEQHRPVARNIAQFLSDLAADSAASRGERDHDASPVRSATDVLLEWHRRCRTSNFRAWHHPISYTILPCCCEREMRSEA